MAPLQPISYQNPAIATQALATQALAGQLTPPPSPGQQLATIATPAGFKTNANIGKLRRAKVPQPLNLKNPSHEVFTKHLKNFEGDRSHSATPKRKSSFISDTTGKVSPLSPSFDNDFKSQSDISKPASLMLGPRSPLSPGLRSPTSIYSLRSPVIARATTARQLPISSFTSSESSRANTITSGVRPKPELPKLVTIPKRSDSARTTTIIATHTTSTTTKAHGIKRKPIEKALPPPPSRGAFSTRGSSPTRTIRTMRTILPREDPDVFVMPHDVAKTKRAQTKILRSVQSIGILHSGPAKELRRPIEFDHQTLERPTTSQSMKMFHKRLFSGAGKHGTDKQPIQSYSVDFDAPKLRRRFSQASSRLSGKRKTSVLEDPLMPVSVLPVSSNHESVVGGLTYLPRYTNNFAGFCKSAWRLQLADPKSFEIRNRNSTRQTPTLKCSKCTFEGPLHPQRILGDRYIWAKIPDSKVYSSFGISYTWQFLFKSHLTLKKGASKSSGSEDPRHPLIPPLPKIRAPDIDMADGLFGCIFCCAQGRGTPVFKGPEALSWHLRSHAQDQIHDEELIHRFRIIIGREAHPNEKFDVHIPQLDTAGSINGVSVSVSVTGDGHWEDPQVPSLKQRNSDYKIPFQRTPNRTAGPTTLNTPMLEIAPPMPWETKAEKDGRMLATPQVAAIQVVMQELPGDSMAPVELAGQPLGVPMERKGEVVVTQA